MKHIIILTALLITTLFVCSCKNENILVKGSGPSLTNTRQLNNFKRISLDGSFRVELYKDSVFKVDLIGQQNILNLIETNVKDDKLSIGLKKCTSIRQYDPVTIKVHVQDFSQIEVCGSGSIYFMDDFILTNLSATISGSGSLYCKGSVTNRLDATISGSGSIKHLGTGVCQNGSMTVSGSGNIYAEWLQFNQLDATISGSGEQYVYVNGVLNAKISGSGHIHYRGKPELNVSISGSGRVIAIP